MPKYTPKPRGRSHSDRRQDTRAQRKRFLIVCEGAQTEPEYFRAFPTSLKVEIVGTGFNTVSLVREAVEIRKRAEVDGPFDESWCVFDKDDFSADQFNTAIKIARNAGFQVAYSNQSFELWYVLHFRYQQSSLHRTQYYDLLAEHLGRRYQKDARSSREMYTALYGKMETAIQNAERLLALHEGKTPEACDPATTVHLLVKRLRENARP